MTASSAEEGSLRDLARAIRSHVDMSLRRDGGSPSSRSCWDLQETFCCSSVRNGLPVSGGDMTSCADTLAPEIEYAQRKSVMVD